MSTFISYSRVNSAFVVRLARDLKAAGFDVFLDQLDIPKGARWDDEIEKAVESSSTFMIVLAPESMESQNVKDELSYAIDSGKLILPVVIKPCKIPLRLRRFQYVDFTDKPYKDSLAEIKRLLSNTRQIPRPPAPVVEAPVIEPEDAFVSLADAMPRDQALEPEPLKQDEFEAEGGYPKYLNRKYLDRKYLAPAVLVVALGMAAIAGFAVYANRPAIPVTGPTTTAVVESTSTPEPPTDTPTITPTPLPLQVTDSHGVTMMLVSGGEFTMGNDNGEADEAAAHKLFLSDFYIDKYEVTNGFYYACVNDGACKKPIKDASRTHAGYYSKPQYNKYPVVYVTWDMANDYCSWRGARLPTEAEWEKAARGPSGNTYPWGDDNSCDQANSAGCKKDTEPVNSYENGQSIYKVFNLAGNVAEWVSSLYMPYPYDTAREDSLAPGDRVIRGGSFSSNDQDVRLTARQKADPSTARENLGFRCAGMPRGSMLKYTLVTPTSTPTKVKSKDAASGQGIATSTRTPTPTATLSIGQTPTGTPTPTDTLSVGQTPTGTPTPTDTISVGPASTDTPTPTDVVIPPTDTPTDVVIPSTDTPTDVPPPPKPTDTPTDAPPPPPPQDTPAP